VTIHPSGWLLLSLEPTTYTKLGLAGKKSVSACGVRYLVTIKLRGLYNRSQHHKRVTAALSRMHTPVALSMLFLHDGVPQVRCHALCCGNAMRSGLVYGLALRWCAGAGACSVDRVKYWHCCGRMHTPVTLSMLFLHAGVPQVRRHAWCCGSVKTSRSMMVRGSAAFCSGSGRKDWRTVCAGMQAMTCCCAYILLCKQPVSRTDRVWRLYVEAPDNNALSGV
jgi:hypothetical protein